jgi:hypothetical protein
MRSYISRLQLARDFSPLGGCLEWASPFSLLPCGGVLKTINNDYTVIFNWRVLSSAVWRSAGTQPAARQRDKAPTERLVSPAAPLLLVPEPLQLMMTVVWTPTGSLAIGQNRPVGGILRVLSCSSQSQRQPQNRPVPCTRRRKIDRVATTLGAKNGQPPSVLRLLLLFAPPTSPASVTPPAADGCTLRRHPLLHVFSYLSVTCSGNDGMKCDGGAAKTTVASTIVIRPGKHISSFRCAERDACSLRNREAPGRRLHAHVSGMLAPARGGCVFRSPVPGQCSPCDGDDDDYDARRRFATALRRTDQCSTRHIVAGRFCGTPPIETRQTAVGSLVKVVAGRNMRLRCERKHRFTTYRICFALSARSVLL